MDKWQNKNGPKGNNNTPLDQAKFYEEVGQLYGKINELGRTISILDTTIRDYNNLREDLRWVIGRVKEMEVERGQAGESKDKFRAWAMLFITGISVLTALASLMYTIITTGG